MLKAQIWIYLTDNSYIFPYGPLTNQHDQVMFCGVNRGREKMAGFIQARPRGGPRPGEQLENSCFLYGNVLMAIYGWITHQLKF